MSKVIVNDREFDLDVVANLMDDELREELNNQQLWDTDQKYVDAYVAAHAEKFGQDFIVN